MLLRVEVAGSCDKSSVGPMLKRRRFLSLATVGLASAAVAPLLAACGQAPAPPSGASPAAGTGETKSSATQAASAQASASSPAPKPGGTLVIAVQTDPGVLEPSLNLGGDTQRALIEIYDRLVNEDLSVEAPVAPMKPGLAAKWTASTDSLQYTFNLRQGVKFHDGTPLDANAVKFNIDRLTQPNSQFYYARGSGVTKIVYGKVASTEVVDPLTVRVQLSEPYADFPDALSLPIGSYGNPETIKKYGNEGHPAHASGTGAFKFVEHQKGVKLVMARNPDYWGGAPPLEQVVWRPIPEPTAAVSALLSGEVQLVTYAQADSIEMLKGRPELAIKMANVPLNVFWGFNMREKPFNDKRVRQALNYAVDRETYTRDILKGLAAPATSVFGPSMIAYEPSLKRYSYDLDKARSLLREAGLEQGFSFKMQTIKSLGYDQLALYVKDNLAKLRINVEVELFEQATFAANLNKEGPKPGVGAFGWSFNCNPPFNLNRFFTSAFAPPNGANFGFYANPEVDQMLGKIARTIDRDERINLYRKLDAILTEDAPWLYLYYPIEPRVSTKKLTWVSANSFLYTLRNASLA